MYQQQINDVTQQPGFIFILTNPSHPGAVRIGRTTRLPGYEAAELSSCSGLP